MNVDSYKQLKTEAIIEDIKNFLDNGKMVNISSGCVNDTILSYKEEIEHINNCYGGYNKKSYVFITTACIFPKEIKLENFQKVDYEEWKGNIFIEVL
ncbi:MAG: hypothetical protein PHE29_13475 [Tissierellia bacterium]|nr:hypothetical protein [Tissierellia bacterium]MDD4779228.1 hypothetical protein [Tissierellia bacterium]